MGQNIFIGWKYVGLEETVEDLPFAVLLVPNQNLQATKTVILVRLN